VTRADTASESFGCVAVALNETPWPGSGVRSETVARAIGHLRAEGVDLAFVLDLG
jgi:hypothetical protein